jgi:ElaB/YqjD/DUF883 family membrane-anchored ribosome-binding protein
MDPQPDVIRQEIEETRSSITEKLETLECQVKGTVQTAKETVQSAKEAVTETIETAKATVTDTIDTVKSSVQETVQTVKRTFDLEYQVDRHPWAMSGLSVAAGFAVGMLLPRGKPFMERYSYGLSAEPTHNGPTTYGPARGLEAPAAPPPRSEQKGFLGHLLEQFDDEIQKVKGIAIGAVMASLRDMAKQSLPNLAPQIDEVMTSFTRKVGGEPVANPLASGPGARPSACGAGYDS